MAKSLPISLFALLLLGGCVEGYPLPLYSPITVGQSFGYSHEAISNDSYRVTYLAPAQVTYAYGDAQRSQEAKHQLDLAYDMALWRAADLAREKGFKSFRIAKRDNDSKIDVQYDRYETWPYHPFFHHRGHFHYPRYGPMYYPGYYDRYAMLTARVTIVAERAKAGAKGSLNTAKTIENLHRKYPEEAGPSAMTG